MESLKKAAVNFKDKLTKTGLERLIIESTMNDDAIPPKTTQLAIADRTISQIDIETIMRVLWENLKSPEREWKKINKTLCLIHSLLLSGSPRMVNELRDSAHKLKGFETFSYRENGVIEKGGPVRDKARQISYLLANAGLLEEERENSRRNREKYVGISSDEYGRSGNSSGYSGGYSGGYSSGSSSGYSGGYNSYENRSDSYNYQAPTNERVDKGYDQIFGNQSNNAPAYSGDESRYRNPGSGTTQNETYENYQPRQEQGIPSNGNNWPPQSSKAQTVPDIFTSVPVRRQEQYQYKQPDVELIHEENRQPINNFQQNSSQVPAQMSKDIFQPISSQFPKSQPTNQNLQPKQSIDNFQPIINNPPPTRAQVDIFQPKPTNDIFKPKPANDNFQPKPANDIFQPAINNLPSTRGQVDIFQPISQPSQQQSNPLPKQQDNMFKSLNTKPSPATVSQPDWTQEITNLSLKTTPSQPLQMLNLQTAPVLPSFPSVNISQGPSPQQNIPLYQSSSSQPPMQPYLSQPTVLPYQNVQSPLQLTILPGYQNNISQAPIKSYQPNNPHSPMQPVQQPYQPASSPPLQPQAYPAPPKSNIKIAHNLDTTSGISISQLKFSPSLVQSQVPQAQQKPEKPINLEDALLGLEDLSSSLSTSKEREKPQRNLGYL
ncbi:unnamed protein product [Blepharisma stoltei]|uniref:ENTH domain-containing protein n=1 Tax=Blepharisma stoltei TaxID=1481888 RepID=A0AAU9IIB2_9CILI|nr:unnamed protein product [Blepharisma stoltei]